VGPISGAGEYKWNIPDTSYWIIEAKTVLLVPSKHKDIRKKEITIFIINPSKKIVKMLLFMVHDNL